MGRYGEWRSVPDNLQIALQNARTHLALWVGSRVCLWLCRSKHEILHICEYVRPSLVTYDLIVFMARGRSTTHDSFQWIDFNPRPQLFRLWKPFPLVFLCPLVFLMSHKCLQGSRMGEPLLWKQCGTALSRPSLYSSFLLPGLLFLGLVIAIFMRAPA